MVKNKFCGIFIDYNSKEYSLLLLKSISSYGQPMDVHIVNNFDDFKDYGQYDHLNVTVHNIDNVGYFQSINVVLDKIEKEKYGYLLIGNNDLEFKNDVLSILDNKVYDEDVYCIAPDIINRNGIHQNPHVVNRYGFIKKLKLDIFYSAFFISRLLPFIFKKNIEKNNKPYTNEATIHMGNGSFYILRHKFIDKIKRLDTPPFLYGEEAFLSNQVYSNGGVIYYDPEIKIYHDESVSTSLVMNKTKYNWSKNSYKLHRRFL